MEEINYRKRDMADQHQMHLRSLKRMLERYKADSQKESRRKDFKCKYCTYINSGIGGSAITISKCKICGQDVFNGSTDTDIYCQECAKKYNLCSHCGGNLD